MASLAPRRPDPRTHIPLDKYLGLQGGTAHLWWLWEALAVFLLLILLAVAARVL